MIQVFILHWADDEYRTPIWFTLRAIKSIQEKTSEPYELIVVDNYSSQGAYEELKGQLPEGVELVKNDRSLRSVASGRNKVLDLASGSFVLLHPDVLVTRGWLRNFRRELEWAEEYFDAPAVITPTYVPYPLPSTMFNRYKAHYAIQEEKLASFAQACGVPFKKNEIICYRPYTGSILRSATAITDDGNQLMIFIASKRFIDVVGPWDESFTARDYDDCDWGIRALMAGCKNLQSHTTFIHHLQGHSYVPSSQLASNFPNQQTFIAKWGQQMLNDLTDGSLWIRLHDQAEKR